MIASVKSCATRLRGFWNPRIDGPILRVLQATGMDGVTRIVEVLEEAPAMVLIRAHEHAHLIVPHAVDVKFPKEKRSIIDEELPHFLLPEREAKAAGVSDVTEVLAVAVGGENHPCACLRLRGRPSASEDSDGP